MCYYSIDSVLTEENSYNFFYNRGKNSPNETRVCVFQKVLEAKRALVV